jgi:hypothetical protein
MEKDNREWLRTWVKDYGKDLTPKEQEKAVTIANEMFHGNVGVGTAAQAGVEAVKKLRE